MARLRKSADFERVLGSRSRARTAHFAMHHLGRPLGPASLPAAGSANQELSTDVVELGASTVDDSSGKCLGVVVPKRHARRAVTRVLLKRQIYAASERHASALAAGLWVVRLRAPFDRTAFPSAASAALRLLARSELDCLFRAVARPAVP
ncbi:MAG: ribonuclease P protein component [Pseudomonadota bacterium]|nr:ribonuclease P protein component [Pseudomonadota bacterium]